MKCEICSQDAGCCRYGAKVCNSCGSFFRRQVVNPKSYQCRYFNNCEKYNILKCKSCRLRRCFQVGMKPERVNFFSPKSSESGDSVSIENIIYAQVLETLLEVCKEDYEGTVKYLKEGDPKVQDIAAFKFNQNHQLKNLSKRTKVWSRILSKYNILQDELPLLFQLLVAKFAAVFYNLDDTSIKFHFNSPNVLLSRFKVLESICQRSFHVESMIVDNAIGKKLV